MLLARRNLTRDRTRLALSVTGVALSGALILLLAGYRAGVYRQASAYLDNAPGSAVIAERGIVDFLGTTSALGPGLEDRVATLPGVVRVVPVVSQFVVFEEHDRKDGFFLIGYDPAKGGGPWRLETGREPATDDEVVVDATTVREHGLALGGRVRILDRQFTIVGLSGDTTFWAGSIAFARLGTLETLLRVPGIRSFLLVTLAPGRSLAALRSEVDALGADTVARADMIANDRELLARVYDAPIGLMVVIAFVVGVLVVGLVIYTATVERRTEYGALKAVGATNGVLYRVVASQALIAGVLGAVAGAMLALVGSVLLTAWRPQFRVDIDAATVAIVVMSSLLMAALGALVPARSATRLEPAEVLRG